MVFDNSFICSVNRIFQSCDEISENGSFVRELSLENNNVFNRYLITKVNGDEIEIPIIARDHIEWIISNNISPSSGTLSIQTIILPLYENSIPQSKRAFNKFINQFFIDTDYSRRLRKITSAKGEVYYGGKGLIFDDRYNPLILCVLKAKKVQVDGSFKVGYLRPVVYINPIVFTESDKLINKGIIKKIIPYYTSRKIPFPTTVSSISYNAPTKWDKAVVIIDNLDRFFVKPTVPNPQSCTTESLNECLVNNIDDILSIL